MYSIGAFRRYDTLSFRALPLRGNSSEIVRRLSRGTPYIGWQIRHDKFFAADIMQPTRCPPIISDDGSWDG
jgi:hypothetical protein